MPEYGEHPWEKQKGETQKSYMGFKAYRNLGRKRTLMKATIAMGRVRGYCKVMEQWSCKYQWVERCNSYDMWVDRQEEEAEAEERTRARTLRRRALNVVLGKALEAIDQIEPEGIDFKERVEAVKMCVRELREEWNELPDQHIQVDNTVDFQGVGNVLVYIPDNQRENRGEAAEYAHAKAKPEQLETE